MSLQEAQQILGVEKNATLEQARKVRCHQEGTRVCHMLAPQQALLTAARLLTLECLCPMCMQKFEHLFHVNEEHGSFYLQSKVRSRHFMR